MLRLIIYRRVNITSIPNYEPASEVSVYPTAIKSRNEAVVIRTFSGSKIDKIKVLDLQGKITEVYINEVSANEVNVYFKNEPSNGVLLY